MTTDATNLDIDVVLFDMGGVLVELGPLDELLGGDGLPADEFWPRWLSSPAVRALESGRCSIEEFGRGLVDDLQLAIRSEEVIERFAAFPRGLYPGAVEVVRALPDTIVTGVLSNTNELHWEHQRDAAIIRDLCDHAFLSYRLGLVKPDRELFDRVVAELDRPPGRILFLDDNSINVEGARAAGLRSEVARGPDETAAALARHGLG